MPDELVPTPAPEVTPAPSPTPTPAPAPSPTPAPTLLAADPAPTPAAAGDPPAQVAPADFPADWRTKLAGEDKSFLKRLDRFTSPAELAKSYRALEQRLSSGELKKALPENATAEELTTWRKENGVPEKVEDYKIEPPAGFVFGDADKPMLDSFKTHAHGKNWTPGQLNQAVEWYAKEQEQIIARQAEKDDTFRQTARDSLYTEWGAPDFRRNLNAINNLLATQPADFKDRLMGARLADGRLLGDDPAALKWLANLSREINPAATLVPVGTSDPGRSVDDRLAEIRKFRQENPDKYDADKPMHAEELQLLVAQGKMKGRAA